MTKRYLLEIWGKVNREPWATEKIVELDYDPYLGNIDGENVKEIRDKSGELSLEVLREDYIKRKNISSEDAFNVLLYDTEFYGIDDDFELFDWAGPENTKENWEKVCAEHREKYSHQSKSVYSRE